MTLDPDKIAPNAKKKLIQLGKRYGSDDTLAQAELTLSGLKKYGAVIAVHGFGAADALRLEDCKQALINAGVGRQDARAEKKTTDTAYDSHVNDGKRKRKRARTVLANTRRELEKKDEEAATKAVQAIDAVLKQVAVVDEDAHALATQLDALAGVLKNETVAEAAKDRGGPEALKELEALVAKLRDISQAGAQPRGTPAATQLLDLIDGLIIETARSARDSANSAAAELGDEAIAKAFALTALERPARAAKPAEKTDTPPIAAPPIVPAAEAPPPGDKPTEESTNQ